MTCRFFFIPANILQFFLNLLPTPRFVLGMAVMASNQKLSLAKEPTPEETQNIPAAQAEIKSYESTPSSPQRRTGVFGFNRWHRGLPYGAYNPWFYGYDFGDMGAGYYGGSNYTRYYAYTRGFPSLGDFPDSLPGKVWTNDPKKTPYLDQMPHFYNNGDWPSGLVYPGDNPNLNKYGSLTPPSPSGRSTDFDPGSKPNESKPNPTSVFPSVYKKPNELIQGTARIVIIVPQDANLTLENIPTKQQGSRRVFVTPPLEDNLAYAYRVRAVWDLQGNPHSKDHTLVVRSGEQWTVVIDEVGVVAETGENNTNESKSESSK